MDNFKVKKLEEQIKHEIADIFLKDVKYPNKIVTVTIVKISTDYSIAKIYLSVFPTEKNEKALEFFKTNASKIRMHFGNKMKNKMRKIPVLTYYIDDSLDYVEKINKLLDVVKDK